MIARNGFIILWMSMFLIASCGSTHYETYREPRTAVASWYGPEFHGKPTASGEIFDMNSLSCAHRELPFGTILKVTNLSREKSVTCTINDRGPFVSGRDIDLSYAAAKEIGLLGAGTETVMVQNIGRDLRYVNEVRYVASSGPFTIQVGSFREMENARRLKAGLDLKYKAVYVSETIIDETTFYRVRVGKFQRKEEAFSVARSLAEEGYSPLIMHCDERV
ncbi:MAG: septal ring lytic transglycosylase RlpA family protein [Thermodesulfovibrionales bacterium]|jgi:rare lipoprotein A